MIKLLLPASLAVVFLCLPAQADDFPKTYTLTVERDGSVSIDRGIGFRDPLRQPPSAQHAPAPDQAVERTRDLAELARLERECREQGRTGCATVSLPRKPGFD